MHHRGAPTWRFHTGLCKFLWNIVTNICSLGKHINLKLGEVSFAIYLTLSTKWFSIYFFIAWQWKRSIDSTCIGFPPTPFLQKNFTTSSTSWFTIYFCYCVTEKTNLRDRNLTNLHTALFVSGVKFTAVLVVNHGKFSSFSNKRRSMDVWKIH